MRLDRRPLPRRPRPRPRRRRPNLLVAYRRRPHLRWALAAVLAGSAGFLVHGLAAAADDARARWGEPATVAIATRDLPAGDAIAPGDVELRRVPEAVVPDGAATEAPVGEVVSQPVFAGEVVLSDRLAPEGLSGVAALLPPGSRAVAIPADPAVVPPLDPGDAVDVHVAAALDGGFAVPVLVTSRAPVVEVTDQAVTIAVPASQVPDVASAATSGLVSLALVGA